MEPLPNITTESRTPVAAGSTPPSPILTSNATLSVFDPRYRLPGNQLDPLYLTAPQTWSQRNPDLGTQPQRLRATTTAAARATRKVTTARNKVNAELLSADIEKYMELQCSQIEKIAKDHSRKVSEIEKLITHCTNYRHTRAPSLANALTHKKGLEMNEGNGIWYQFEYYTDTCVRRSICW